MESLVAGHLYVHARFCMRASGIWNLVEQSDDQEAKETAIDEAFNCQSGRMVIMDNESGKAIEPEFDKSIIVIEYPPRDEQGRSGCVLAYQSNPQRRDP